MWHTFKQNSSTFNFWPPYNPMGSFWSPIFQNAQWCQSGISLFVCQDMSKSQKQQKYCNYTRLPSSKFILLFFNSTKMAMPLLTYLDSCGRMTHTLFGKIKFMRVNTTLFNNVHVWCNYFAVHYVNGWDLKYTCTQQTFYSISHLCGLVTTWWLGWLDSDSVVTIDNCQQHSNYTVDKLCSHHAAGS